MGLIDAPQVAKRDTGDEDLEHGSNKINLIKASIANSKRGHQNISSGRSTARAHAPSDQKRRKRP